MERDPKYRKFYITPLWTGKGCTPPNFCCSHSGMPWFCKTLPVPTTDYIEIHNCHNQPGKPWTLCSLSSHINTMLHMLLYNICTYYCCKHILTSQCRLVLQTKGFSVHGIHKEQNCFQNVHQILM